MEKLIKGILDFRQKHREGYLKSFAHLAQGQSPEVLFISCSDSRVVPNLFASADPGELFVVRNVGNTVPCCHDSSGSAPAPSEVAALEFAVANLGVNDIVVCGHSDCGAMKAIAQGREKLPFEGLKGWLKNAEPALKKRDTEVFSHSDLSEANQLSQVNVLLQLENLLTYPFVKEKYDKGELGLHGWWFDIAEAHVYAYSKEQNRFSLIEQLKD
jgi:carbonic anhydrase